LEITVTPQRRMIEPGQETTVDIHFAKIDVRGGKEPIAGKTITIKIKGLIDGSVSPTGEARTDAGGNARITYRAGKKDKQVTFSASHQPEEYEGSVQGKAEVRVSGEHEWSGTLTIEQASTFHCGIEPTKETGWQEMTEKEERTQRVSLALTSDDFDLARIPAAGAFPQMIEASGTITCNISARTGT
jgi:hypothetical protein